MVGFTSTLSLPNHSTDRSPSPMISAHAARILRRSTDDGQVESPPALLWTTDPIADAAEPSEPHETAMGACLLAPHLAGVGGWGTRRKVKYIDRRLEDPSSEPSSSITKADDPLHQVKRERSSPPPLPLPSPSPSPPPPSPSPPPPSKRKGQNSKKGGKREIRKRVKVEGEEEDKEKRGGKSKVDRWSAERYEAAEMKLVEVMRGKGAGLGTPILRQALREEARRHIGDTGLLDHLLKHMVGKVVVGGGNERFRRRHNADGELEYWLEPAELSEIRRKAGVVDPYWVPPPGWKLGDPTAPSRCSADCQKEMNRLREEVATLKRVIEQLKKQAGDRQPGPGADNGFEETNWGLHDDARLTKEIKRNKSGLRGAYH